ncbi:MAG: hypothetical protein K6E85_04715 [Lachnospiraceae bacterium]|nr:hypothetical protein [Lachnospiraceae bacterium]
MKEKQVLGMSFKFICSILAIMAIGIIVGSFFDLQISESLSNTTTPGSYFQDYANVLSYCIYPIAGVCLYKGFLAKGERYRHLAVFSLVIVGYWSVHIFNLGYGKYLRRDLGYNVEEGSSGLLVILTYLICIAITCLFTFIAFKLLDDKDSDTLIAIGLVIVISGIINGAVNDWLKLLACRVCTTDYSGTLEGSVFENKTSIISEGEAPVDNVTIIELLREEGTENNGHISVDNSERGTIAAPEEELDNTA